MKTKLGVEQLGDRVVPAFWAVPVAGVEGEFDIVRGDDDSPFSDPVYLDPYSLPESTVTIPPATPGGPSGLWWFDPVGNPFLRLEFGAGGLPAAPQKVDVVRVAAGTDNGAGPYGGYMITVAGYAAFVRNLNNPSPE